MWNRRQSEFIAPVTAYVAPAANVLSAQTLEYRVRPSRFRLEAALFQFVVTTSAAISCNCEGLAGLVEEVEVSLNDGLGSGTRQCIKASGPALIEWARQNGWKLDPFTAYAMTDGVTAPTGISYLVSVPILFRHPLLQEPKAMVTSIPLYGPRIKEDVVFKIKLRASTAITATATPFSAAEPRFLALYREPSTVSGLDGYIPTEFKENVFFPNATGTQKYRVPAGGFLTGLLMRNQSTNAYSATQTTVGLVNASTFNALASAYTGKVQLAVGKSVYQEFNETMMLALNCATAINRTRTDLTANSGRDVPAPSYYIDLLADYADTDASNIRTALNLEPVSSGGDDVDIVFNDWLNSAYACRIATHKLLPFSVGDLATLAFAV